MKWPDYMLFRLQIIGLIGHKKANEIHLLSGTFTAFHCECLENVGFLEVGQEPVVKIYSTASG